MIGLQLQGKDVPALLGALRPDQEVAVAGDGIHQHGLPALGAPDQVVHDQVDTVVLAPIFHVDNIPYIDR